MVETVKGWPGIGLSSQEFDKEYRTEWAPNLKYSFSAGEAMSHFLAEMKEGRFAARECKTCRKLLFPPRMFCEECYRPTDGWVQVRDTGVIETFSVSFLDLDAKRIKDPIFVGVIILDGPDYKAPEKGRQRMGMMHYFGEIKKDPKSTTGYDIKVGMRVRAKWKSKVERTGSVLDVEYFRPMSPSEDPFAGKKAKKKGGGR